MQEWIDSCPHQSELVADLVRLDEGSEHHVYQAEDGVNVIKITRRGIYGEFYYLVNGIVHQENSWPLEYLQRMKLWEELFGNAPAVLGMTRLGQFVSRQKFIVGTLPTQEETDRFLSEAGLLPAKQSCWLWKRPILNSNRAIWVGDARTENFVRTQNGIIPIDIRLWSMVGEAGLS